MKVRKILSMIVTSAILVSTMTVPTTNATTSLSVQKADTVFAADTETSPAITTKTTTMATIVGTTPTTTVNPFSVTSTIPIPKYCTLNDDGLMTISGPGPYNYDRDKVEKIVIEEGVTKIIDYAFEKCKNLKEVTISDSVTSIGVGAFSDCNSLVKVTIPDSVTSIGDRAFSNCSSLSSITIPDSVQSLGDDVFAECQFESIQLPGKYISDEESTTIVTTLNNTSNATTTTLTTTMVMPTTHKTYVFDKVLYYPEKTVYNTGEELNIKRLLIRATENPKNNPNNNTSRQYDESYFSISSFNVTDKNEKSVSGSKFNTLPAGDYTVSYDGTVGNYYDFNWCTNVKFSYNVTIIDNTSNITTNPITTSTTTSTTTIIMSTHPYFEFKKVKSYPTKTTYNKGEKLDITGLSISAIEPYKNYPDDYEGYICSDSHFDISKFTVTDKNGNSVSGDKFDSLSAGEYIVSYDGSIGQYYSFMCGSIKFSYNVTINDDVQNSTTTTTTEEPVMWMYGTGVDHFDGIKTLPTKTIYNEGEEFDLSGLVINAYHSVSRHNNKGESEVLRTDYVWEVDNIASEYITISDFTGKTYTVDEFTKLSGDSAYIVKFGKGGYSSIKLSIRGDEYERELYGVSGLTFRVYINQPDKASQFIRIDNAEVESFEYGISNYGFKLKGMDALRIDMDAHMYPGYEIEDIRKGDVVSGALKIDSKSNYVILGDLKIVKYGGETGDANCDNSLSMADAVLIMQALANPNKYGIDGTDGRHMTKRGESIADMNGDGITVLDAQLIQNKLLGL